MVDGAAADSAFVVTHETHSAVIFLVGDRAYKLKKPVDLGFLDFRTRESRAAVCRREVELNRRLAPDVYLGVADIVGPDGAACDHLVIMQRMPTERRLSSMIRVGVPVHDSLRHLAHSLAAFHCGAERGPGIAAEGGRDALARRWTASFEQVRPFHGQAIDPWLADEITRLTDEFLAGREALFADRISAGRIVDGHGDLLADDIFCLDDGPRALDCIEFDDRLRWLDGLDDAASLGMDLERLGTPELSTRFLDWYADFAADPAPPSLRHHYLAYRAFVRAKVACVRFGQGDGPAADDAAEHADLTLHHLRAGEVRLILVGGTPGTGKSTLAGRLADRLGAVALSSDRLRKELAGIPPQHCAAAGYLEGVYTPQWTRRTYAELLNRAETLLARGETVILDASWLRGADREEARDVAGRAHSRFVLLRCHADQNTVEARLRHRSGDVSDADKDVAAAMAAQADPWREAVVVDTCAVPDTSLQQALAAAGPEHHAEPYERRWATAAEHRRAGVAPPVPDPARR